MEVTINIKHQIGDIVYLKTDVDQFDRIVTGIKIRPHIILYDLSCGAVEAAHYALEISTTKKL